MAAGSSADRTNLPLTCKLLQQEPGQQMTHDEGQDESMPPALRGGRAVHTLLGHFWYPMLWNSIDAVPDY